ncbi:HNH endonuclease [Paenibacillus alvei]|nr:HNH endonuclease [Paenibacillus alvei]MCY9543375.1 HNH endonuclease [Paenibacillus alvei]MCY9704745.1 HNH endonuclease [Paenibacillus alvei]MCY9733702.1 HNH endonuclease [Paenibacillus alvei]MCY9755507.1 HNH endonuclease [Paenibacillus alvei]MEC0082058.1 HNH endonuclease [Paenibacillus alvei]
MFTIKRCILVGLSPKKPCKKPGCGELTREGFCSEHAKSARKYDCVRESSSKRGYGRRWRKYREDYLARHPLCVCDECRRKVVPLPADVVDHIQPHKGDYKLFWNPKNHQPMNKRCHDKKTAREDGGFGNG